jgi:gamma-glutamyltranspeptidase/glutathione hydrolase
MKNGQPMLSFQLMGGSQQAQGHMQVLVNLFDLGANLQAASDMARFSHDQASNRLEMESQLYNLVGSQLKALGHEPVSANGAPMGGFQAIMITSESDGSPVYRAGSDHPRGCYRRTGAWPVAGNSLGNSSR